MFKVSGLPRGRTIGGRTAAQMAQEIPHRDRLRYDQLRPGDLLFSGSAHFNSTATEANVIHTGIYLGDNWVIHSSGQRVYVLPLRGSWLGDQFAWGRRVLPSYPSGHRARGRRVAWRHSAGRGGSLIPANCV
ncbi:MAG: NlpC/P60 family protein [Solirubrobacteraceae bacterium]